MSETFVHSEVRHALYRIKNGNPISNQQSLYDLIEPKIPPNETWKTFAQHWDVFVKDNQVTVIQPESDYDFIHSTCLEKSLCATKGYVMDPTIKQANVIQIVELNMLDGIMTWPTYNKTWGVSLDRVLNRISTRLFKTVVNKVTEEMIQNSAKSDPAAMTEIPSIPIVELNPVSTVPLTPQEAAMMDQFLGKTASPKRKPSKKE